jgi:peptidoglycan/LPS O-acetylase OafA/YrhL
MKANFTNKASISDKQDTKKVHLAFLDGIRALMAIIVVMEHIYQALKFSDDPPVLPKMLWNILAMFNVGQAPVVVFICLSGFVLTLPVLKGNFELKSFAKKRFQRIYPPYIAGLVFSVVMTLFGNWVQTESTTTVVSVGSLLTHTFLIHNFTKYITSLNGMHWTVAVEVQIYLLFALVWQPLTSRFGRTIPNVLFVVIPMLLTISGYSLEYEYQLYVTYFTLGGLTAACWTKCLAQERYKATVKYISFAGYVILACVIGIIVTNRGSYASSLQAPIDLFIAIATCLTILNMSFAGETTFKPIHAIKCGLKTPILSRVASYSYSLYLIHYPIVNLICKVAKDNVANDIVRVALAMCGLPISMAVAMHFASVFENQSSPIMIRMYNVFGMTQRRCGLSASPRI